MTSLLLQNCWTIESPWSKSQVSQTINLRREGCVQLAKAGFKKTATFYTANDANFPLSQEGKKLLDRMQSPRRPPGVSQSGSAVADLRFFKRLRWHYLPPLPLAMSMSDYFHLTLEIYPSSFTRVLCGANTRTLGFCRQDQGGRMISDLDFPAFYLRNWHFLHKCGGVHLHPRLQDDISAAEWKFQNQVTCLGQKLPCYM